MKTIGLLGGMSWESTAYYYSIINKLIQERLGGLHSAKIILCSVDFAEIQELQHQGHWEQAGELLGQQAAKLQSAGADCLAVCTNTMHKVAQQIENFITIPLIHIADATAQRVRQASLSRIGVLGTRFTMEQEFYCGRLTAKHALQAIVPLEDERSIVHSVIYDELCRGIVKDKSRANFQLIIQNLVARGAQGVILGCTEIGMLITQDNCAVPIFDSTRIHAEAAVDFALQ